MRQTNAATAIIAAMASHRDDVATLGLVLALVPWLLVPVAGFFLFFGDHADEGPDPRDAVIPWYFAITGLLALAGVVLGVTRGRHRVGRTIATVIVGGGWVVIAALLLLRPLLR